MTPDRTTQPTITDLSRGESDYFRQLSILNNEPFILKNGLPLYRLDAGTQEITKIDLVFRAGSWYQHKPLQAKLTASMLTEGTDKLSAADIAGKIDFHGAFMQAESERDFAIISLFSLNKHFGKILPVIREIITHACFPENEFENLRARKKQNFLVNNQKIMNLARMHFNELIFSDQHPYGQIIHPEDYDSIQREDLINYYNQHYLQAPFRIMVSGRITDEIIHIIEQELGSLKIKPATEQNQGATHAIHKRITQALQAGNGLQSAIRIGRLMFNRKHPDYFPVMIMNTMLGGYFGSRLMSNLREEKGLTYGIGSAMASFLNEGMFFISTEVNSEKTELAIQEIFNEIALLRNELAGDEEMLLVRNYILGQFLRSLDGPFALAERLRIISDFSLDSTYYEKFLHTVQNITALEINEMANKYLQEKDLSVLTVGNIMS